MNETTIPARQSGQEAQHWLTIESYLGRQRALAQNVRDALEGRDRLRAPARLWLQACAKDPEISQWANQFLERLEA